MGCSRASDERDDDPRTATVANQSVCDPTPSEMKHTHQVPCDAMEVKGEAEATWKKMR